jgi:hypothetical protein
MPSFFDLLFYFLCALYVVWLTAVFVHVWYKQSAPPKGLNFPHTAVLAPHYQWREDRERRITTLLNQRFPGTYEVHFVTSLQPGDVPDVAEEQLQRFVNLKEKAATLVTYSRADSILSLPTWTGSQKEANLMCALDKVSSNATVVAVIDHDVDVHDTWLEELVRVFAMKGHENDDTIVSTGYRWVHPASFNLPSLIEVNLTNMFAIGPLLLGMVWGGSFALKKSRWENPVFQLGFCSGPAEDDWLGDPSSGHKVHLTTCLALTTVPGRTWTSLITFLKRQLATMLVAIPNVYDPALGLFIIAGWFPIVCLFGLLQAFWNSSSGHLTLVFISLVGLLLCTPSLMVMCDTTRLWRMPGFWAKFAAYTLCTPLAFTLISWHTYSMLLDGEVSFTWGPTRHRGRVISHGRWLPAQPR